MLQKSCSRRCFLRLAGGAGLGVCLAPKWTLAGFDPSYRPGLAATEPIDISVFEMFKIGPGPSSSHTIAPMKAGHDFLRVAGELPAGELSLADKITVRLYGSLSATGKGHGTDRAVAAGLLGQTPEACSADFLDHLFETPGDVRSASIAPSSEPASGVIRVPLKPSDIVFEKDEIKAPYSNVLVISLSAGEKTLAEREYYSVGGGFLEWKGYKAPDRGRPVHMYDSMNGLLDLVKTTGRPLPRLLLDNEMAVTGKSEKDVREGLAALVAAMDKSVEAGVLAEGPLKGPYHLERRAAGMLRGARAMERPEERFLAALSAYGQAAAEENSQGHPIVTAPTAGSAGVMPAVVHMLIHERKAREQELVEAMLSAFAVGALAKRHASVAGADVGCQGEIGVASATAAALLAQIEDGSPETVENAAECALEHHLGMTCDPVGGYVQIPCIARCAMGAVKAWNAFLMAKAGKDTFHPVGLDVTIRAMAATGRDMNPNYRETSRGGLALYYTQGC